MVKLSNSTLEGFSVTVCKTLTRLGVAFAALAGALALPSLASAYDILVVPDASVIKYAVDPTGFVYLRNLNEVDPTWAGCCGNFWINTNTDGGRAMYSALLTAAATNRRLTIVAASKAGSPNEPLQQIGNF